MPSSPRPMKGGPTLKSDGLSTAPAPSAVSRVRRLARARLPEWGLADLTDDCSLVLSEFVTNALLHAAPESGSPLRVELRLTPTHLLAEVHDPSPAPPAPRASAPDDEGGRGLELVDHLAHDWNWYTTPTGKCVWAAWPLP